MKGFPLNYLPSHSRQQNICILSFAASESEALIIISGELLYALNRIGAEFNSGLGAVFYRNVFDFQLGNFSHLKTI